MKFSKHTLPIPTGSVYQLFNDAGPTEGTAAHQILEKNEGFLYWNIFGIYNMYVCLYHLLS